MNRTPFWDFAHRCALAVLPLSMLVARVPAAAADRASPFPPPKHGNVYVVAHRGAHIGIPENTLAAYRKAIELGVDFVEIDLRLTRDQRLVSIHNSRIDDYVLDGRTGAVRDMTLAELKQLDIGSRVGPAWKDERIPTFEEILAVCQGRVGIYLDLKDAPVAAAVNLVRQWRMTPHVLWYADPVRLQQIRTLCAEAIIAPDPGPARNLPLVIDRFHPAVVTAVWRCYSRDFAATCHGAGAIVIVDEQDSASWEPALRWGTEGIQTDHPAQLIEFLESAQRRAPQR